MIPDANRFRSDLDGLGLVRALPGGWTIGGVDESDLPRLTALLRGHESAGRGWASAGPDTLRIEIAAPGSGTRQNVAVRDDDGLVVAWGSVHDRAEGRMLFVHVVGRTLPGAEADLCSAALFAWAEAQARHVGAARGLAVQQIDTGAFEDDERQQAWLAGAGFRKVRTWWQMSRPVRSEEATLVPDTTSWEGEGMRIRHVGRSADGMPDEADLRAVHDVLEGAFTDHFNSSEETFEEFCARLREDPGHRWDHWWLAELTDGPEPEPCAALVGTELAAAAHGVPGSYVDYIGVLASARGRGVAKGLLHTIIADAASRGRDRIGLEVDADSPTGAEGIYVAMGWRTSYVTQSWHRDVPVA
ncbi:GNAT family N-acetyltransferase [uncultured Nocardioides sp.]|uniref:GNAT family N-acetyltransferase n=1 Tax=uncultured Nocardioides sp. TaxID=198441 RepID=UPI0025F105ED|nr:GNAT family N-acetyltransferase [uncultured Nocardioides sp.]